METNSGMALGFIQELWLAECKISLFILNLEAIWRAHLTNSMKTRSGSLHFRTSHSSESATRNLLLSCTTLHHSLNIHHTRSNQPNQISQVATTRLAGKREKTLLFPDLRKTQDPRPKTQRPGNKVSTCLSYHTAVC
jgi:hypothetical protein